MDTLTSDQRSKHMSRIRGKDTKPEMVVRRMLHGMGYRYRLHAKELPGKPDIVFRRRGKAIFVHGCFWHGHEGCKLARIPKSRVDFWTEKIARNAERDARAIKALEDRDWETMTIWECETKSPGLADRLRSFLEV